MIAAAPATTESPSVRSVPLPPSERDFEVYSRTAVEGRTTREVAAEFNISQTRVMQLRVKVAEWIGTHLPATGLLDPAERLRVAQTLACEQLQYQYEEAMEAWRRSVAVQQTTRIVGGAMSDGVTLVKDSQGDPRYVRLATQISKAIAKLGMATMPDPETAIPIASLMSAANHPKEDCSESWNAPVLPAAPAAETPRSTAAEPCACEDHTPPKSVRVTGESLEIGTVQEVLAELNNVPRKMQKQRERRQQLRRELFAGDAPAPLLR